MPNKVSLRHAGSSQRVGGPSLKALGFKSLAPSRSRPWRMSCKSATMKNGAPALPYVALRTDMATLVASDWQTKLVNTFQGPLQCIMFYAKKAESLLGGGRANRGSLDVPPPKQVDPQRLWSGRFRGGRPDGREEHGPHVQHCGTRHHAGHQDRDTVDGPKLGRR